MTVRDIRWVQTRLHALGFDPGPIDGVRGPRTDAGIVAFKKSIGFRARPYLGPLTLAALEGVPASDAPNVPWMAEASRMRSIHEYRDTAKLRAWFDKSVAWIDPREIPWCGAFVATCFRLWQPDVRIPENPLGARNWQNFGKSVPPKFGALLVFWRVSPNSWQGHVGFAHGEDATHYHVLGGNQSNAVTVTRIAKSRLLACRWPYQHPIPETSLPLVNSAGIPITENEA